MTAFSLAVPLSRRLLGRALAGLLLIFAALPPAAAELRIDITRGVVEVIEGRATVAQMGEMLLGRPQKMDGWEIELLD